MATPSDIRPDIAYARPSDEAVREVHGEVAVHFAERQHGLERLDRARQIALNDQQTPDAEVGPHGTVRPGLRCRRSHRVRDCEHTSLRELAELREGQDRPDVREAHQPLRECGIALLGSKVVIPACYVERAAEVAETVMRARHHDMSPPAQPDVRVVTLKLERLFPAATAP